MSIFYDISDESPDELIFLKKNKNQALLFYLTAMAFMQVLKSFKLF